MSILTSVRNIAIGTAVGATLLGGLIFAKSERDLWCFENRDAAYLENMSRLALYQRVFDVCAWDSQPIYTREFAINLQEYLGYTTLVAMAFGGILGFTGTTFVEIMGACKRCCNQNPVLRGPIAQELRRDPRFDHSQRRIG